jgi:hypothetical protein
MSIITEFTNVEERLTSFVSVAKAGGYNVFVRDDETGNLLPCIINVSLLHEAIVKAKELAGLAAPAGKLTMTL